MNIIGTKNPGNYFHLRYIPSAVGELCSFVHIMLVTCVHVFTHCVYTNTGSTNTDTPSGATPTVQDVTASCDEHSEQGMSVHNRCYSTKIGFTKIYS